MQIVIVGTGNIATVLSLKLHAANHTIVQVYGRNHDAAAVLAGKVGARSCSRWDDITQAAELYIIAIADRALNANEMQLQLQDQLVVHTAGAVSKDVLKNSSSEYGVFYPFQTIRKEILPLPEIPLLVDASSNEAKEILISVAKTISQKVSIAGDAERLKYHLCAIMTNNFSNYLYTLAEDYCNKNGLDFSNLLPLIEETASRLHRFSPRSVQTGPAIRKDTGTIQRHLQLLTEEPELKKLYSLISDGILKYPW